VIFYTTPKNFGAEKTSNFAELPPTRHQSEARNFETAQHINKQKTRHFIYDKCAKNSTKLGASPHWVLMPPREKIDKL